MDAATCAVLQNAMRAESRSFLQYVRDAFPRTTSDELAVLAKLQALTAEELQGAQWLAQFLVEHKQPLPYVGTYPMSFTSMNFVSLDHLLPILVKAERRSLADRERDISQLHDSDAKRVLGQIVDMKRRHLQMLEEMAAAHPETRSTVRTSA
jgi:rubrerythrin